MATHTLKLANAIGPSIGTLRKILRYEPDTGRLFWRERPLGMFTDGRYPASRDCAVWNTKYSGKEAFTCIDAGYKCGGIFDKKYRAHRVVWAMHYGEWPNGQIDHENHDRADNRILNLRDVGHQGNQQNCNMAKNNTSGVTGVVWCKRRELWRAQIMVSRKSLHIGYFEDIEEAAGARLDAEIEHGFHTNHGQPITKDSE